uniref:Branched-chain amino acid transport system ATP-binding protein n=1 Tax=Candidatus Kentrum eta TaxID=2126337 RepID=A0A450VJA3_9GAMM|nr:MAG: branched-chain amino acid transport system ATP-binding protein [Candidatus Kentron sp. H]VFK00830.1 MAG: branched-chain amino acid transport system ATP-binding protein [Candidatus Kentron sp. H]VFK04858.1 MAG: branched-chain amino acid transport system ATP-binding protein [Candidatus Kentron sp. H]
MGSTPLLSVRGLHKAFGGAIATRDVSLDVYPGETHAIIGPNGAGKTTLIAQLSGMLMPDRGEILFGGQPITRLPAWRRSHLGFARSFQITSVFDDMTLRENVALAVQAHEGHSFRFWGRADRDRGLREKALRTLERIGLAQRADDPVAGLSHGERRALEIALTLATDPRLLLLDEPMAGMGSEESAAMVDLIRELKAEKTILLVEHDMDAVFALADRLSVLAYGGIIGAGTPEEIRNNPAVQRAYLGGEG